MIHKIKALHNEGDGLSIRSIACQLGISRNTVRKYLRMDEAAIGEQQSNRTRHKQLDDYRDYIVTLLGQFPHLSAVKVLRKLKERHPELGVSDRSARRCSRRPSACVRSVITSQSRACPGCNARSMVANCEGCCSVARRPRCTLWSSSSRTRG